MKAPVVIMLDYAVVTVLDIYSTVIQRPEVEENPLMRELWASGGDWALVCANLLGMIATLVLFYLCVRIYKKITCTVMAVLTVFKLLIVLTNLALIPYWVTGWYQF